MRTSGHVLENWGDCRGLRIATRKQLVVIEQIETENGAKCRARLGGAYSMPYEVGNFSLSAV
jgi:hypothetical protein